MREVLKEFVWYPDGVTQAFARPGETYDFGLLTDGLAAAGVIAAENAAPAAGKTGNPPPHGDEPPNAGGDVPEIPANWAEMSWPQMRSLAAKLNRGVIGTKDDAVKAITDELEARAAATPPEG